MGSHRRGRFLFPRRMAVAENSLSETCLMKITNLLSATLFAALAVLVVTADTQAGVVSLNRTWGNSAIVAGNPNTGGLDSDANAQIANGDDSLNLAFTIDDNLDTGAMFSGVLTLSGTTNGATNEISTNPAGRVTFAGATERNNSMTLSVGSLVETTATGATINFDGFTSFTLDQFSVAADSFDFDGQSYVGNGNNAVQTIAFTSSPTSGTIGNPGTGQFRFEGLGMQYTVSASAVPEPGSAALLGLGALGFIANRRRRV